MILSFALTLIFIWSCDSVLDPPTTRLWSSRSGLEPPKALENKKKTVTRFDESDVSYKQTYIDFTTYNLHIDDVQSICKDIINTPYFQMKREVFVNLKEFLRKWELQKYYPKISKRFLNKEKLTQCFLISPFCKPKFQLKVINEYITHKIQSLTGISEVETFPCLALQLRNNKFKEYFISRQRVLIIDDEYYLKHHLFSYDRNQKLILEALVEDAPTVHTKVTKPIRNPWRHKYTSTTQELDVQTFYVYTKDEMFSSRKRNFDRSRNVSTIFQKYAINRICGRKQPDTVKLRICAAVLSEFDDGKKEIQFWPTTFNIDYKCRKANIVVGDDVKEKLPYSFRVTNYEEWLLGCKGYDLRQNKRVTLYVSEVNAESFSIISYRKENDKFLPWAYYTQISPLYYA